MGRKEIRKPKQDKKTQINKGVAEVQTDSLEDKTYKLSFDYFDEKMCNFGSMRTGDYRKVFEFLSHICRCKTREDIKNKVAQEIEPVAGTNEYKKFYKGLTSDVEIKEFDAGSCRGFFFFDDAEKLIHLRAIVYHPEYKKNFR